MVWTPRKTVWTRQPQRIVRLNPDVVGSSYQGFVARPLRSVGQRHLTSDSTTESLASASYFRVFSGAVGYMAAPAIAGAEPWTLLVYGVRRGTGSSAIATLAEDPGSSTSDRSIGINAAGKLQAYAYDGGPQTALSAANVPIDTPFSGAAVCTGTQLFAWLDGVPSAATTVGNAGFTGYSTPELIIGYGGGPLNFATCAFSGAYVLKIERAVPGAVLRDVANNPWLIFQKPKRRIFAVGGAASPTTITGGIGAAAAAGQRAALALHTVISTGIGATAAAGQAATITVGSTTTISATIGAAAAAGAQANIAEHRVVAGGIGAAAAAGVQAAIALRTVVAAGLAAGAAAGAQASVAAHTVIGAGVAGAVAAGSAAAINVGAGTTISATVGAGAAAGHQANIAEHKVIGAGIGAAAAAGQAATLALHTTIAATVGNATAAGQPATVAEHKVIGAAIGAAVAAGQAATINVGSGVSIAAGVGGAVASGAQATVALHTTIAAAVGATAAAGQPATVALHVAIAASLGLASADGARAALALHTAISAGLGAGVAAGLLANVQAEDGLVLEPGRRRVAMPAISRRAAMPRLARNVKVYPL